MQQANKHVGDGDVRQLCRIDVLLGGGVDDLRELFWFFHSRVAGVTGALAAGDGAALCVF